MPVEAAAHLDSGRAKAYVRVMTVIAPADARSVIVARLVDKHELGDAEAHRLFSRLLEFLDAASRSPVSLVPGPDVDLAWHELILHTELYADFCDDRYGRFIHHTPVVLDAGDCKSPQAPSA